MASKQCKGKVKKDGALVPCGTSVQVGYPCPNRSNHLSPIRTGQCINGWCEGTKPRTASGNPAPSCRMYLTCPCKCHTDLDRMFKLSGMERILVEKSDYRSPERTWWMPSDAPVDALSNSDAPDAGPTLQSPVAAIVPPTATREFGPTATGRAARGELEAWVKNKCDEWLVEKYPWPCTPSWLSMQIGKDQGITEPSVGAISSVFARWEALGFANVAKKPIRFLSYTEEGLRRGLEGLKADAKRKKRMQMASQRRGVR